MYSKNKIVIFLKNIRGRKLFKKQNHNTKILWSILLLFLLFPGCSGREGVQPITHSISGTVNESIAGFGLAGVTISLTGAVTASVTTDSDGNFSFSGLSNGNYTITPSFGDYSFDPVSLAVAIDGDDVSGRDFMAIAPAGPNSISGQVTGDVSGGVTIALSGTANKTTSTDTSGNYSFNGLANGSYTVTPSLLDYGFDPVNHHVTISDASQTGKNFTSTLITTSTYAQSDLTGRWKFQRFTTLGSPPWIRIVMTIDASGVITCESYEDSDGQTSCPNPFNVTWTIDEEGRITEGGANGNAYAHMTMAADKNFISGTGSLRIAQKISTTFSGSDLNNTSFVYHRLRAGTINEWRYGTGSIASDGAINITGENSPSGSVITPEFGGTLSVDSSGVVALTGHGTFKGFLSDDKKTIIATETDGTGYVMTIMQITGKSYSPGSLPDSISNVHMIAGGTSPAPLYALWVATTFNGIMSSSHYSATSGFPAPTPSNPSIDANGVITIAGDTYHGQLSHDEKFIIGTKTLYNDTTPFGYALIVHTIK